jgi:Fe2+ or Zn2+ uptake regulation protein
VADSSNEQAAENGREKQLEQAVVSYLHEHPHAMDTLEGIAEWWIMRQKVRVDIETLTRALERMTDRGLLERIGSGESARYRLKK